MIVLFFIRYLNGHGITIIDKVHVRIVSLHTFDMPNLLPSWPPVGLQARAFRGARIYHLLYNASREYYINPILLLV